MKRKSPPGTYVKDFCQHCRKWRTHVAYVQITFTQGIYVCRTCRRNLPDGAEKPQ